MNTQKAAKHTPGPWRVESQGKYDYQVGIYGTMTRVMALKDFSVALTAWGHAQEDELAQAEANARLIAAAPELLAALKAVPLKGENCRCHEVEAGDCDSCPPKWLRVMIRAAIAKAEGREVR